MKPQAAKALAYLREHGPLTRQVAFMSLDIANLTAVMSDVRKLVGHDLLCVEKVDPKGRRYASYRLRQRADRVTL